MLHTIGQLAAIIGHYDQLMMAAQIFHNMEGEYRAVSSRRSKILMVIVARTSDFTEYDTNLRRKLLDICMIVGL